MKMYLLCVTPATGRVARYVYHRGWWHPRLQNVAMVEPREALCGSPEALRMLETFRTDGPGGIK